LHSFPFRDCAQELEAVGRLLADARRGTGGCLVLRGEPGIGETALLEYAVGQAAGMRSVRVTGIESESRLGFAAAHELLVSFLSHVDRLPPPQRDALRTVAGLVPAPTPERFLVGLAIALPAAAQSLLLVAAVEPSGSAAALLRAADRLGLSADAAVAAQASRLLCIGERATFPHPVVRSAVYHGAALPERRRVHAEPAAAAHRRPNANDQVLSGRSASALPEHREAPQVRTRPLKSDAPTEPGVLLRDGLSVRLTHGYPAAVSKLRAAVSALLAEPAAPNGDRCDLFAEAGRWAPSVIGATPAGCQKR
jgi:hypothetical protein